MNNVKKTALLVRRGFPNSGDFIMSRTLVILLQRGRAFLSPPPIEEQLESSSIGLGKLHWIRSIGLGELQK